jgi:hypothetical protein
MVLVKDGKQQIWVRALDGLEPAALAGTDGAGNPFWSPDSRFIGFFADTPSGRRMASTSLSVWESRVGESTESHPPARANGNR